MIPRGSADTGTVKYTDILDRIAVRSDLANWRLPSPWPIGFGISSAMAALPTAKIVGNLTIAKMLLVVSLIVFVWLLALVIRRLWCDRHPYLSERWLSSARTILGDTLVDAALDRLRNTSPHDPDRVLRRGEMIEAILDERSARIDARKAALGVRLSDTTQRL